MKVENAYLLRLLRLFWRFKFRLFDARKPIILILQPGKVGSSSLYGSLKNSHWASEYTILHVHAVSAEGLAMELENHKDSVLPSRRYPKHIVLGEEIARLLSNRPDFPLHIITITREPISREFSSLFESLPEISDAWEDGSEVDLFELGKFFSKRLEKQASEKILDQWFDRELKAVFGFDVLSQKYNCGDGFLVMEREFRRLLVFRIEDSCCLPAALNEFFRRQDIPEIRGHNIGDEKWYADQYKKFKTSYVIGVDISSRILSSRYGKTFYAEC